MNSEVIGSLIRATAIIVAAIITGWFSVKAKDKEIQAKEIKTGKTISDTKKQWLHWLWGIGGAIVGGGLVLLVLFFIINPPTSIVYDDFDNAIFDGKWDPELWIDTSESNNSSIQQEKGILRVSNQSTKGSTLRSIKPGKWPLDKLGFVEAKVMLDSDIETSGGMIYAGIDKFASQDNWWINCGLSGGQGALEAWASCWTDGNVHGMYETNVIAVQYNTWYTLRFEIDSTTANIKFFVDGQEIGSYTPFAPEKFKETEFSFLLAAEAGDGKSITGYFDKIRIGASEQ